MKKLFIAIIAITISFFSAKAEAVEGFKFVLAGDPQPFRLLSPPQGYDPNANKSIHFWRPYVETAFNRMLEHGAQFVMINGDMTEFGWEPERNAIQSIINQYRFALPIYYGLGNHDILNNVGDCRGNIKQYPDYLSSDACAFQTSNMLRSSIVNIFPKQNPNGYFSHSASGGYNSRSWRASNAYAFDWGSHLRFIQLNEYPAYEVHLGHSRGPFNVYWNSAIPFLQQELEQARKDNKIVVIGWHDADDKFDLTKPENQWNDNEKKVAELLKSNNDIIILLSAGHEHKFIKYENYGGTGIDMYLAGAMFNSEFNLVDYSYTKEIYKSTFICTTKYTYTLDIEKVNPDGSTSLVGQEQRSNKITRKSC